MLRILALSALMLAAAHTDAHGATPVTVFLERGGGTLRAGWDDGEAGTSSLLAGRGIDRVRVPAYRGTDSAWDQTVSCVRDRFSRFNVTVVDQRPAGGSYLTVMVGGQPSMVGYPRSVSGVAPYNGGVIKTAVAFVFSDLLRNRPRAVCESTAHEVGHALGLDHTHQCKDLMSYLHGCGEKRFVDADMSCGEYGDRGCSNGHDTQNSYRILAANVGVRRTAEPIAEPPPARDDDDGDDDDWYPGDDDDNDNNDEWEWAPESWDSPRAPETSISEIRVEQRWRHRGERRVTVTVVATGASVVELAWATSEQLYLFRCDEIPSDIPVACQQRPGVATFTLAVGAGERAFAVRVTGPDGRQAISEPQTLPE